MKGARLSEAPARFPLKDDDNDLKNTPSSKSHELVLLGVVATPSHAPDMHSECIR